MPKTLDIHAELATLVDAIEEITSNSSLSRGLEYYKKGRVLDVTVCEDGFHARVAGQGRKPYDLAVHMDATGEVEMACDCPVEWEDACKHVVAALYEFSSRYERGDFAEKAPPKLAVVPKQDLFAGMPRAQLDAWAKKNDAASLLKLAYTSQAKSSLTMRWLRLRYAYSPTMADVLLTRADPNGVKGPTPLAQAEVVKILTLHAARVAREKADAQARLTQLKRPDDRLLGEAWDRLSAVRAAVREVVEPRPSRTYRTGRTSIQADPPAVVYTEEGPSPCSFGWSRPVVVELGDATRPARVLCACRTSACALGLTALDAALDCLCLPELAAEARALSVALATPRWQKTLAALDDLVTRAGTVSAAAEPAGMLGWKLSGTGAHVTLQPTLLLPKKSGGGFKLKKATYGDVLKHPDLLPADRAAIDVLSPPAYRDDPSLSYRLSSPPAAATRLALKALIGHPRVVLDEAGAPSIAVRRGEASLSAEPGLDGHVALKVRLGAESLPAEKAVEWLRDGVAAGLLAFFDGAFTCCTLVEVPPGFAEVVKLLASRGESFPVEAFPSLYERVPALAAVVPTTVAPALRGAEVEGEGRLLVRLSLAADGALGLDLRAKPLSDARAQVPGEGPTELYAWREGAAVWTPRDLDAEAAQAVLVAEALGLDDASAVASCSWRLPAGDAALDALAALRALEPRVTVEWADDRRIKVSAASVRSLRVQVTSKQSWFALGGELDVEGGVVPLSELLAAVRESRRFVAVGTGHWVEIDAALRDSLAATAEVAAGSALPRLAAPIVDALAAEGATIEAPKAWTALLLRMHEAAAFEPEHPVGLTATLRDYQAAGVRWLLRLAHWAPGACLADDMGLGKTVQALAVLLARQTLGPALVVAPTSVGFNWVREAETFAPGLSLRLFRGRQSLGALDGLGRGDVVITSYDLVALYEEQFTPISFATVVLDEAQAIKNAATRRAKAAFALQSGFTVALTGTPVENHTGELWSIFRAAAPGLLGTLAEFQKRFAVAIERQKDARARRSLARLIRPFVLRRLKADVAPELPPRTEVRMDVELSHGERALYDELRAAAMQSFAGGDLAEDENQRRIQVLAVLTRLRQLACHPRLYDPRSKVASSKLAALRELVAELKDGGHRALLFSQFTTHLALVREALDEDGVTYRYLDGQTPAAARRVEVDAFQRGEADLFLLSLKAGGTGLNLTAADYVIHLDPWWNPAVEDQATDRAHRIGQDKAVTVYRLVARGTVEEGILAMHGDKRALMSGLLDGTETAAKLSTEELMALIAESGRAGLGGSDDDDEVVEIEPPAPLPAPRPALAPALASPERPLLERLHDALAAAIQAQELSEASAGHYRRVAERFVAYAEAENGPLTAAGLPGMVAAYRDAIDAGTRGPKGDKTLAFGVGKWLAKALSA